MPGYKNVGGPRFVGAGGGKKKAFPRRQKVTPKRPGRGSVKLPDRKPMPGGIPKRPLPSRPKDAIPKTPRPLPSTPKDRESSNLLYAPSRPSPEETAGRMRDALYRHPPQPVKPSATPDIKAWEDRNRSNNKTKLNP